MTKFYATLDSEGVNILENAQILEFDSQHDAEKYLRETYREILRDAEADGEPMTLTVEPGRFGDCWLKVFHRPTEEELAAWCEPFAPSEILVSAPGTHPGGRAYWIEPSAKIFVANITNKE